MAQRFGLATTAFLQAQPPGRSDTLASEERLLTQEDFYNDFKPVINRLQGQIHDIGPISTYDTINAAGQFLDAMSLYQ